MLRRALTWTGTISLITISLLALRFLRSSPVDSPSRLIMPARPTVTLRQGTFIGSELRRDYPQIIDQFLGIPYGLPTGGSRRFRPPAPVNTSSETFDAFKYGARCPSGVADGTPQQEDCLNANVFRPKVWDKSKKLPVLIHVHGGGYNFGAGQNRKISSLVAFSSNPMIGISFNYRVGAFGFLPSSLTAREGSLNVGLKDQALLFEWAQENVAEFGGDPSDVTLIGESAGAHSVCSMSSFIIIGKLSYTVSVSLAIPNKYEAYISTDRPSFVP